MIGRESENPPHPYQGRQLALATKHQKQRVLGPPLRVTVGLELCVPVDLDTDLLGTFSGEVDRQGPPRAVALRKARLGMTATGLPLGLASEGSFGPHPQLVVVPADQELLAFVDDELGFEIVEQMVSTETNFAYHAARKVEDLKDFLTQARFPSHGLVVRPNSGLQPGHLFKGITQFDRLKHAVEDCAAASADGLAHVETDMRAHMNPTRRRVLHELATALGRRLATLCPKCRTPGWGLVELVRGLPCEWCGGETDLVRAEVHGCPRCAYRASHPRSDGLRVASPDNCPWCNP